MNRVIRAVLQAVLGPPGRKLRLGSLHLFVTDLWIGIAIAILAEFSLYWFTCSMGGVLCEDYGHMPWVLKPRTMLISIGVATTAFSWCSDLLHPLTRDNEFHIELAANR